MGADRRGRGQMTKLPPLPFQERRDIILTRLRSGSMVLPAAQVQFMGGDSEYRYRPDSELLYATGWAAPNCVALLRGFADEHRFVLFVPERDAKAELWTGPRPDLEEVKERYGALMRSDSKRYGDTGVSMYRRSGPGG